MSFGFSRRRGRVSIPDSAIHRWKFDEGSGSTAADSIGTADGSITGASWVSNTGIWQSDHALDGDGTDDTVGTTTLGSFGRTLDTDFSIGATIKTTTTDVGCILGVRDGAASSGQTLAIQIGPWSAASAGEIEMGIQGDNGNFYVDYSDGTTFNDGSRYRLLWNKTGNSYGGFELYANDSQISLTNNLDQGPSTFQDLTEETHIFAWNDNGSLTNHYSGVIDDVTIYNSSLGAQEITDDYQRQPWS